jgi:hypothetical protein
MPPGLEVVVRSPQAALVLYRGNLEKLVAPLTRFTPTPGAIATAQKRSRSVHVSVVLPGVVPGAVVVRVRALAAVGVLVPVGVLVMVRVAVLRPVGVRVLVSVLVPVRVLVHSRPPRRRSVTWGRCRAALDREARRIPGRSVVGVEVAPGAHHPCRAADRGA